MARSSSNKDKLNPGIWRPLLEAALDYARLAPWRWLWDTPVFGVKDPVSGEVIFCSVLGRAGDVFGLLAFPGAEGFWSYLLQMQGPDELSPIELEARLASSRYLSFHLGSRDETNPAERTLYRDLGLTFRGRRAWPVFRSTEPGYYPGPLDETQVRLLSTVLRQATRLAQATQEQPQAQDEWMEEAEGPAPTSLTYRVMTLLPPKGARAQSRSGSRGRSRTRSSEFASSDEEELWARGWTETSPREPLPLRFPVDRPWAQTLAKHLRRTSSEWEVDLWPLPMRLGERGKPAQRVVAALCVDSETGMALNADVSSAAKVFNMADFLCTTADRAGSLPTRIRVHRRDVAVALVPAAAALDIRILALPSLELLGEFYDSLAERMGVF